MPTHTVMSKNTFTKFYRSTYTYLHMRARKHARTHTINIIMSKISFTKFYRSTYTYLHMHARKHARTHTINIIITATANINIMTEKILVRVREVSFSKSLETFSNILMVGIVLGTVTSHSTAN